MSCGLKGYSIFTKFFLVSYVFPVLVIKYYHDIYSDFLSQLIISVTDKFCLAIVKLYMSIMGDEPLHYIIAAHFYEESA